MKKNIVVIAGGNSSEYEVSIKSGNHIFSEVDGEKYNKYLMILRGRDWMVEIGDQKFPVDKNDFSFEYQGKKVVFDFAYITIHGNPGENGMLQGYLDMMGVPYSTCNTLVEAITFDKYTCTNYLNAFGINTTHPIMLVRGKAFDKEAVLKTVGLPCFVKPNAEGSSFGVSKVKTAADFDAAVEGAFKMCREILVESFIDGIEFTCGLYKVGDKKVVMPVAEVVPKKNFSITRLNTMQKCRMRLFPDVFLQRLPAGFRIWLPRYMTSCGVKESSVSTVLSGGKKSSCWKSIPRPV